ncbi:hypothetical protein P175DRAFT_0528085 [Aspergillus ochraceoroseus IBT 24754]|uniref:Zn(2)-C6 fungal-type domain-containing protein n=3 Tax=Aspergillus subgen. Nidulantes TaxID=2720870 RepID=A0A0F8U882_9EURO|nr:uncharacterized protein P175DRAFT_0528085 [Aspergillus ochraceoroseus IBT 24754]KKK15763.1 hypothetical protein ARAM_004286 [Aspergillus rambellii]KKK21055.1 hypothetical protein AOCH_004850 [Aspergillus ochraceoroseus]PTU24591.1 hypothetical protein P175DRAFT_0528085 [Aspergillus ochraceoroseus IBT 24754]
MADGPVSYLEAPENYTRIQKSKTQGSCMLSRFSKWLWSGWDVGRSEVPDNLRAAGDSSGTKLEASAGASAPRTKRIPRTHTSGEMKIRSQPQEQLQEDLTQEAFPCRACKAWGVACDLQKPQCAHCVDQQLLCFYVAPLRLTMKRSKKVPSAGDDSITHD